MEILQCKSNLRCIKLYFLLGKPTFVLHIMEKFSTWHKIHHKVDSVLSLEYELHLYEKGVIYLKHNETL